MTTDSERREVARMLRELPGDSTYPDLIGVIADRDGWYPASDAADRLADLIEPEPERTCHDTDYSRESITCSECGEITMNTLYFVDLDGGYRTVKSHRPRFCSNCGAKVIGEETDDAD